MIFYKFEQKNSKYLNRCVFLCIFAQRYKFVMHKWLFKRLFKKDENFGIVIYQSDVFGFDNIQDLDIVLKCDIDNLWWKWKPLLTQADPFLFVKDNVLYLFYEKLYAGIREKGHLAMMKTTDLKNWSEPIDVLALPCHLSFPFVFEDKGDVYMIPESSELDSVGLYKANEDLSQFTFVRKLIEQPRTEDICFNYCDSHILKKDGLYYLFTSVSYRWKYDLELYYSDDLLTGQFKKHPLSPVCRGNEYGRCGGSVIHNNNDYYRITQDCHDRYGENVSIMKVLGLDRESYVEELYKRNIFRIGEGVYRDGVHQLNIVKFRNKFLYATDFQHLEWSWFQSLSKLLRHITVFL